MDNERGPAAVGEAVEGAEPVQETYFETIQRLAALPVNEYERCRKTEAKRLEMRATVLDKEVKSARPKDDEGNVLGLFEPESWPEEIDGDDLLSRLVEGLRWHVVMPTYAAVAVALWVIHCHCFENWQHTPRLGVYAPEKACGKSTLLDVIACLVPRAIKTENLSTATMFRCVDAFQPTLLIDEVDTFLNDNEELRGALNAGHAKGGRHLRCEGDNNEIKAFKTFAPAALAGIGLLPPTLADRTISVTLQKRRPDEHVQDFRSDRIQHLHDLASQIVRWVADHETELRQVEPHLPERITNRPADNWRPLISIAAVAGSEWIERAHEAVVALTMDDADSIRVQLLGDIRKIFQEHGSDSLPSKAIAEGLHAMEDQRWPEYGRSGKPISVNQIARLLRPFRITPGTIRRGVETSKGYKLASFNDVFTRYLPPQTVTLAQTSIDAGLSPIPDRHNSQNVTVENSPKAAPAVTCAGVTVEKGGGGPSKSFSFEDDPEERAAIQEWDGDRT